jgi:DNA helicase-2/ATP-dependent DNA helicase PcrA
VDFDDLLSKCVQLLEEDPGAAEFYQRYFQFILVDEYQDTNKLQSHFIDLLAMHHRSVMVVGDDAQSIYSWRGANYQNILDFPKRYPDAMIYRIETNYQSKYQTILKNIACAPRGFCHQACFGSAN